MGTIALLVGGLALFVLGAELLLVGASLLARALQLSPLIIGLTVVPLATSTPELVVSINAAATGQGELAVGNVVGSNTFNVLFILGILALVAPLPVSARLVRTEVPIMIGASMLLFLIAYDGRIAPIDGLLLLALMAGHVSYVLRAARQNGPRHQAQGPPALDIAATGKGSALVISGGIVLSLSAQTVVGTIATAASEFGLSQYTLGLTFIAVGTSLPELATTIVAVARGEHDLAVGNVVGSNIFNILTVLGVTAIVARDGLIVPEATLSVDLPVMVVAAVVCLPIVFSGRVIDRWEGALLMVYYLAYIAFGWLRATGIWPSTTRTTLDLAVFLTLLILTVFILGRSGIRPRTTTPVP